MHALKPRALRDALGIGERDAAKTVHVGRGLLREYEADPSRVKTPAKRRQLDGFYQDLALVLTNAEQRARAAADGLLDGDDEEEEHLPATEPVPHRQAA